MKKSFRCLFVILLAVASFFTAIPCTSASERAFFFAGQRAFRLCGKGCFTAFCDQRRRFHDLWLRHRRNLRRRTKASAKGNKKGLLQLF